MFSYQEVSKLCKRQGTGLSNAMGAGNSGPQLDFYLKTKLSVSSLILVVLLSFQKISRTVRSEGCESP